MGQKKIVFLLSLLTLSSMHTYSQGLSTKELHWKKKEEIVNELYDSMNSFIKDTTPVIVKNNKTAFFEMDLSDWFNKIFKKNRIDKKLTLQKQKKQQETKDFLESHFVFSDTITEFVFFDKNKILEWGKNQVPFSSVYSRDVKTKNSTILILKVIGCSGLPCINIYIFKKKGRFWSLIMSSNAQIKEPFTINVDTNLEKILFKTKLGKIISELPYTALDNEF
ncbi:hypothetical protein [Flavobacterium sp. CAU 1735]|uniref:hypothetical protein n=1 Tax=Flavobacterium sp. CAU 1735 TaxID=3140361 RepID=UPI0032611E46